jgi:Fe-S oxidoreductase
MAKIKYEVLAQRNKEHGAPLRAKLFANIATLAKLTSPFAPIANALSKPKPVRMLMQRFGGVAAARPLPVFASQTFPRWFKRHTFGPPKFAVPRGDVVLFHDTFTDYFNPEVGQAATRVLEGLGYNVILAERTGCCGRPAISKGLLPDAIKMARRNVDALLRYARRGVPIVGTEPSCILSFRDEYPDLLRDDASREVAKQTFLLDELIVKLADEDKASVQDAFKDGLSQDVLLHAHCHQKAIVGPEVTLNALRLVPGYTVRLVDTSCCGMAGSFGFEAEHYETSKAMGAMRLFPAVEAASADTEVAITGVSCRQQIGHFTSRKPRHAIELLADALK